MKKLMTIAFALISFSAFSQPVFLYPNCSYFGNTGECTVWNTSGKDISCNIQVNGYTKKGNSVSSYDYRVLYMGMQAWLKVSSYGEDNPITSLQASAFCNTL